MYPRSRGKSTPLGGSSTDPEAPSFTDNATAVNTTEAANTTAITSTSTPSQPQPQQPVRPRRSPQLPYAVSGSITVNLSSSRNDGPYYPPPSPHQLPPPPPPPQVMQGNAYYDGGNVSGGPAPYYGGTSTIASPHHHAYMPRGTVPTYDQPPPPPPPPPQGPMDGEMTSFRENIASTPTSPPNFAAGVAAGSGYPSFSQHSRTSSTNNAMGGVMGGGVANVAGSTAGGDYRPPPVYGDLPLGGSLNNNTGAMSTNSGNSSFSRVGPTGSGHAASLGSTRLPPYVAPPGSAAGAAPPPPPPPPPSAAASSFSNRYHEAAPLVGNQNPSIPAAATASTRLPRGPQGLKITVGGNTTVVPNPVPVSPLLNSPIQAADSASSQGVEALKSAPRGQGENRSPPINNSSSEGANLSAKARNAASDAEPETSTTALKPTVEQAEARYQYLYEEFRKMSRVRAKLAEDAERLKRELAASAEEVRYYRQKTLTAAEEREAIVHDYNADIHYLLRLVDALASDVLAAHKHHKAAPHAETSVDEAAAKATFVPSTPQLAIDVAASRLATIAPMQSAFATAAATPDGSATMPPETPGLAEHLGLRHGVWMTRLSKSASEIVDGEDDRVPANEILERSHSGTVSTSASALTAAQKQALLLRDEMRDVHRNTHAAMSSYMTSLDFGNAPVSSQRRYAAGQQSVRHSGSDRFSQRQFHSEYRGLHLHVEVPRFHAQSAQDVPVGVDQPLGHANDGANSMNSSPALSYNTQRSRGTSGGQ